ncbi:Small ribosomal subunit protein uS15-like protein [Drosera capensis]
MASSLLRCRRRHHHLTTSRLFSSTPSQNPNVSTTTPDTSTTSPPPPRSSSILSDIKSRLKNTTTTTTNPQSNNNIPSPSQNKDVSVADIRKSLSGFRAPVGTGTTTRSTSIDAIRNSLRGLGVAKQGAEGGERKGSGWLSGEGEAGKTTSTMTMTSIDAIRNSLRGLGKKGKSGDEGEKNLLSLENYTRTLRLRPDGDSGDREMRMGDLRGSIFGKEKDKVEGGGEGEMMRIELYKQYGYAELGEKIRMLRPDGAGKEKSGEVEFSFGELGERLAKLRMIEEREAESRSAFGPLRNTLMQLGRNQPDDSKKWPAHGLDIFGRLGEAPRLPPKEELVVKYFHPDNMSSAEKLKIKLKNVRDEFKMSDSDCGSTRVQIAQLTTEINHLSSVLHKKDKHSRRGLIAKVQRRKTLLKYLRRTDWDSYRLVLSRFGLRDNPDYKQLAR